MTDTFHCGDGAALVAYLYDEGDDAEHAAMRAHLEICPSCAAELSALSSTRSQLASWTSPETELGFIITRARPEQRSPEKSRISSAWMQRPLPVWAQGAAAATVFAGGLWLGMVQGRGSSSGPAEAAPPEVSAPVASAEPAVSHADLAALEARLREEIAGARADVARAPGTPVSGSDAQILARVRTLIDESEARQRRELALRTADVLRDFDSQRRVDLEQIQRTVGQIEGVTGAEVRQQRQMLNYLIQVSQQQQR
jgi:hypothetical protein